MENIKSFGSLVKNLREERNLTLREVSSYLEIDISMLGKIEKNSRKPTRQMISKFSTLFKISEKELTVEFLSDNVVHQILYAENFATDVLRAAEKKVKYLKVFKDH